MIKLYPGGEIPHDLADLMGDCVICEATGEPVKMNDPERLSVEPWGAAGADHS